MGSEQEKEQKEEQEEASIIYDFRSPQMSRIFERGALCYKYEHGVVCMLNAQIMICIQTFQIFRSFPKVYTEFRLRILHSKCESQTLLSCPRADRQRFSYSNLLHCDRNVRCSMSTASCLKTGAHPLRADLIDSKNSFGDAHRVSGWVS